MTRLFQIRPLLCALLLCAAWPLLWAPLPAAAQRAAGAWQPLAPLPAPADDLAAVALPDGSVLVVGGNAGVLRGVRLTARYRPGAAVWQRLPDAPVPMSTPALLSLSLQEVLVVEPSFALGGSATPSRALLLDPHTGTWQLLPSCPVPLLAPRLVRLSSWQILAVGGVGATIGAVLNLHSDRWTTVPSPVPNLATYAVAPLGAGRVLLIAEVAVDSHGAAGAVRRAFALEGTSNWHQLARPPVAEDGAQAATLDNGQVLLAGGYPVNDNPRLPVPQAQIYTIRTNSWRVLAATGPATRGAHLLALPGGRALLIGGHYPAGMPSSQCMLYARGIWHSLNPLPGAWSGYALVVLPSGGVMLIGGDRPMGNGFGASDQTLLLPVGTLRN
jgi:hypothetical protein